MSSGAFPADEKLVSIDLIRTCAVVASSKWEAVGYLLIYSNTVEQIRERTHDNIPRMMKVLESWKLRTTKPTVRDLLKCFERVGINRREIETQYFG